MQQNPPDYRVALKWVVEILEKHRVPFVVTGGLAAKTYGSKRALFDIDLDIPDDRFSDLLEDAKPYIISGPASYQDEHWKLFAMTLQYDGWNIDLSGAESAQTFDQKTGKWIPCPTDLSHFELCEIDGIKIPVMSKDDLVAYKRLVGRDTDLSDIDEIIA